MSYKIYLFDALSPIEWSQAGWKLEGSEVVNVRTMPLENVSRILRRGDIEHALVVAAFGHMAFLLRDLARPEL